MYTGASEAARPDTRPRHRTGGRARDRAKLEPIHAFRRGPCPRGSAQLRVSVGVRLYDVVAPCLVAASSRAHPPRSRSTCRTPRGRAGITCSCGCRSLRESGRPRRSAARNTASIPPLLTPRTPVSLRSRQPRYAGYSCTAPNSPLIYFSRRFRVGSARWRRWRTLEIPAVFLRSAV